MLNKSLLTTIIDGRSSLNDSLRVYVPFIVISTWETLEPSDNKTKALLLLEEPLYVL